MEPATPNTPPAPAAPGSPPPASAPPADPNPPSAATGAGTANGETPQPAAAAHPHAPPVPRATTGRIVHYVLDEGPNEGSIRPAIVIRADVESGLVAELQIFSSLGDQLTSAHRTVARYGTGLGEWHWPARA